MRPLDGALRPVTLENEVTAATSSLAEKFRRGLVGKRQESVPLDLAVGASPLSFTFGLVLPRSVVHAKTASVLLILVGVAAGAELERRHAHLGHHERRPRRFSSS